MSQPDDVTVAVAPEDVIGKPTLAPEPGRIVDAELVAGEQLRVTIRHVDGPVQTAYDRVEADPHRSDLIDTVRGLCNPPDTGGTPSTMAGWPSIQGRMADRYGLSPEQSDAAVMRAVEARDLSCVRWDGEQIQIGEGSEGKRYAVPLEESFIKRAVAEFNRPGSFDETLIEHCQALLEEVDR